MAAEPVGEPFELAGEQVHVHYDDDDLLLFESYSRSEEFHLSFTRQFGFHTAELEYFGMNAVWLEIRLRADDSLRALPDAQVWGRPPRLAAWVTEVQATPAFGALDLAEPLCFYVAQSDI